MPPDSCHGPLVAEALQAHLREQRLGAFGVLAALLLRVVAAELPGALAIAAFAVLCVALARPTATVALPRLEGTLMLVFDVSGIDGG